MNSHSTIYLTSEDERMTTRSDGASILNKNADCLNQLDINQPVVHKQKARQVNGKNVLRYEFFKVFPVIVFTKTKELSEISHAFHHLQTILIVELFKTLNSLQQLQELLFSIMLFIWALLMFFHYY